MISFLVVLFCFEFVALLMTVKNYKKYSNNYMSYLLALLLATVVTEGLSLYFLMSDVIGFNVHYYYSLILFNCIYLTYSKLINSKKVLLFMVVLNVLFSLFWFSSLFVEVSINYILIFGSLNTSIYCFLYLRELLVSDKIINYKKVFPFWLTVSFIIFYMSSIPFFLILKYMNDRSFYYILYILGIIMYSGIIYGLIWSSKEQRYL